MNQFLRRIFLGLLAIVPAAALAAALNINTATQAELETLPGIGESKAVAIIQYRTDHGAFKTVDELDNVPGIGESTLANLRPLVTVGDGKTTSGAAASTTPASTTPASTTPASTTLASTTPASTSGCMVNINTADSAALQTLPGIGESKAAAIIQYRTDHGKFATCDSLDDVSGIGPATVAALKDCCSVK